LCVEVAGKKPVGCSQLVLINLIGSGFNVDDHKLVVVLRTDPWPDLSVVDFVAATGEFLFAVSRFWHAHPVFLLKWRLWVAPPSDSRVQR